MRVRRDFLAVALLSGILGAGCALKKTVMMMPLDGGAPIETIFTSGVFATGGDVAGRLVDGRTVAGRWSQVDDGTDLGLVAVATPRGPITATALTQTRRPNGVATLYGDGLTVLCVFSGTYSGGTVYCGDSEGRRYFGNW